MPKKKTIVWTKNPAPSEAYYYICKEGGTDVGIIRLFKNEEVDPSDCRSFMPVHMPAPPIPGGHKTAH